MVFHRLSSAARRGNSHASRCDNHHYQASRRQSNLQSNDPKVTNKSSDQGSAQHPQQNSTVDLSAEDSTLQKWKKVGAEARQKLIDHTLEGVKSYAKTLDEATKPGSALKMELDRIVTFGSMFHMAGGLVNLLWGYVAGEASISDVLSEVRAMKERAEKTDNETKAEVKMVKDVVLKLENDSKEDRRMMREGFAMLEQFVRSQSQQNRFTKSFGIPTIPRRAGDAPTALTITSRSEH